MTAFIDTNVVVYAFDDRVATKQRRGQEILRSANVDGTGVVSVQVLQEFCNLALRKFARPMSTDQCLDAIDTLLLPICRVVNTPGLVRDGLRIHAAGGLAWYDALIVAAALAAGCDTLWSEDMQHGRAIAGCTIRNPFI